jgi:hypothetical protein
MKLMQTTFAHGNGPYSRCLEWAISVNDELEKQTGKRLPIVLPLVYPGRQERIMKEEIDSKYPSFTTDHPNEIWLDRTQGELLHKLMFKSQSYEENLDFLISEYENIENQMHTHLDGKRVLENFLTREMQVFDLRDIEFQLGLNNRVQTPIPIQYYTAGGAGPFDEILERAIKDPEVKLDKDVMKRAIPIAKRMIENQKIIFSNDPGVFSYDGSRILGDNEVLTPPFVHPPKQDNTSLPGKGIYFLMTGIDGVREGGMYDSIKKLGMQIYAPGFSINNLPENIRETAIALEPSKINNPSILAQYSRAGWSSVWLAHMAEKGFLSPRHDDKDDPEILFNLRGIEKLGLGAIINSNPMASLQRAIELSKTTRQYNQGLVEKYGTIDGIRFSAEKVVSDLVSLS